MVKIKPLSEIDIPQQPRRIKRYLLVWCEQGRMAIQVDEKEICLKAHEVLTITSGQYHYFKEATDTIGYLLEFTLDYFCRNEADIELIFQNGLFCHFDRNDVIAIRDPQPLSEYLRMVEQELQNKPFQYQTAVHSHIELILIAINRARISNGYEIWKPNALFLQFLEFVRNNFEHNYTLPEIAGRLSTTTSKLNELAQLHAGKSANHVVSGLIISEAKRYLQYENLRIKEVSFNLGFQDPFYFSRFFKKHTGLSPADYQKQLEVQ